MNKFNLNWGEKLSIAWEVFIKIFAFITVALYATAVLCVLIAWLYLFFTGKLF